MSQPVTATASSYQLLPRHYDKFVAGRLDYSVWIEEVSRTVAEQGRGRRLLSLGAGTCSAEIALASRGFQVVCYDLSAPMLAEGKSKAQRAGLPEGALQFVTGDMRHVAVPGPFDAVLCHYYALNYLIQPQDVAACFASAAQVLSQGGLFIFDVMHNERFAERAGQRAQRFLDEEDFTHLHESSYAADGTIRSEVILFYQDGGSYHKAREVHLQRIYPLADLTAWLHRAGFAGVSHYRFGTRHAPAPTDKRVVFIATRS